jgi:NitT/TauT family transport system permease protein
MSERETIVKPQAILIARLNSEFVRDPLSVSRTGEVKQPLKIWEKVASINVLRKLFILVLLVTAWQLYATRIDNPLVFPTFASTLTAIWSSIIKGPLLLRIWVSIKVLLTGYGIGIGVAAILTILATTSRFGTDLLETLTATFNPLPAIALLPLAMLWFGLGTASIVFVLVHAVAWPLAINTHSGFLGVSSTLRMVGRNYGLYGLSYVVKILIPAAFPCILTGLKLGWAFAWRTLIASELVFGVSSHSGGLGWFIYENKNQLEISYVFAGLFTVILIGIAVENFIFRSVELRTVKKCGMICQYGEKQ